jgi:pSer/pThr/pTyr-binding forkhead associated (FHA) protein
MTTPTHAWLEGTSSEVRGKRYDLTTPTTRLGRGSNCAITLTDPMVSRDHAEIRCDAGTCTIVDLGSTHGTWVGGQQVMQAVLTDGTRIQLGTSEFVFRLPQDAIPTAMLAGEGSAIQGVPSQAIAPPAATPPAIHAAAPPPPAASPAMTTTPPSASAPRPGRRKRLLIGCGVAALVGVCGCISAYILFGLAQSASWRSAGSDIGAVESAAPYTADDLALALAEPLPDERSQILANLGRPDEFDISIVQVDGGQVRMESWRYYGFGTRVDFVDGAIVWTVELEPPGSGAFFPAWYDPTDFKAGMSIEEASALVVSASPAGFTPEIMDLTEGGDDLAGGTLLVGDQITLGFQDGQLVYVETIGANVGEAGG